MVVTLYKLFLTGFSVLVEHGTMGQLVVGSVISCIVLTVTAVVQPSKHREDDALEMACQAAIVLNLALAILLQSSRQLTDKKLLEFSQLKMFDQYEAELAVQRGREDTLGLALMAIGVVPIVIAIVLALTQLGFFGRVRRGRPSSRVSAAMRSLRKSSTPKAGKKKRTKSRTPVTTVSTAPPRTMIPS